LQQLENIDEHLYDLCFYRDMCLNIPLESFDELDRSDTSERTNIESKGMIHLYSFISCKGAELTSRALITLLSKSAIEFLNSITVEFMVRLGIREIHWNEPSANIGYTSIYKSCMIFLITVHANRSSQNLSSKFRIANISPTEQTKHRLHSLGSKLRHSCKQNLW
jgi:hypothetical protein